MLHPCLGSARRVLPTLSLPGLPVQPTSVPLGWEQWLCARDALGISHTGFRYPAGTGGQDPDSCSSTWVAWLPAALGMHGVRLAHPDSWNQGHS